MTDTVILTVRGEAALEAEPDVATVVLTVVAQDPERSRTLSRLDAELVALGVVLDRYQGAVERRETGPVSLLPERDRKRRGIAGYTGTARVTVAVGDFLVLGELLLDVGDAEGVTVGEVRWSLRPDSPVHARVRLAALADASSRAREYADTLGAPDPCLVELADEGLTSGVRWRTDGVVYAAAGSHGSVGYGRDQVPRTQWVSAVVEARYTLGPGPQSPRPA
ncbi:SIMPL domain-containing protein [Longispora sp. K20-0274]|uniref:SIMPL domain-containing protein n=1 Tax=Longispora sp. K20-0274 TaxID=3088255 RepID=UPI00399AC64D